MNFEDVTGVSGVGQASPDLGPMAEFLVPFSIALCLVVLAFMIAATWKMFKKAGEHGWAAFVPVYSTYVLFKIAWGSGWMFLLMFVPVVGFIVSIITLWKLSRAFNMGVGMFLLLLFFAPIARLILGFGSAGYVGLAR